MAKDERKLGEKVREDEINEKKNKNTKKSFEIKQRKQTHNMAKEFC